MAENRASANNRVKLGGIGVYKKYYKLSWRSGARERGRVRVGISPRSIWRASDGGGEELKSSSNTGGVRGAVWLLNVHVEFLVLFVIVVHVDLRHHGSLMIVTTSPRSLRRLSRLR